MRADHVVIDDLIGAAEATAHAYGQAVDTATAGLVVQAVLQHLVDPLKQLSEEQGQADTMGVYLAALYVRRLSERGLT